MKTYTFVTAAALLVLGPTDAYAQRGGGGCAMSGGSPGMPRETSGIISLVPLTGSGGYPNPYAAMNYQREAARTYQAQLEQSYRWQLVQAQQQSQLSEERAALDSIEQKKRERAKRLTEQREAEKAQREANRRKNLDRRAKSSSLASNN